MRRSLARRHRELIAKNVYCENLPSSCVATPISAPPPCAIARAYQLLGMKALHLSGVLLVTLMLEWIPTSVFSAVSSEPKAETNAFILPKISKARQRLAEQFSGRNSSRNLSQEPFIAMNMKNSIAETDPQFLSVTIGVNGISRDWRRINFTASRVQNMAAALSPAMLRLGGTEEDNLLFDNVQHSYEGELIYNETNNEQYQIPYLSLCSFSIYQSQDAFLSLKCVQTLNISWRYLVMDIEVLCCTSISRWLDVDRWHGNTLGRAETVKQ